MFSMGWDTKVTFTRTGPSLDSFVSALQTRFGLFWPLGSGLFSTVRYMIFWRFGSRIQIFLAAHISTILMKSLWINILLCIESGFKFFGFRYAYKNTITQQDYFAPPPRGLQKTLKNNPHISYQFPPFSPAGRGGATPFATLLNTPMFKPWMRIRSDLLIVGLPDPNPLLFSLTTNKTFSSWTKYKPESTNYAL